MKYSSSPKSEKGTTWTDCACVGLGKRKTRIEIYAFKYSGADKSLARPERKKTNVSVRMA